MLSRLMMTGLFLFFLMSSRPLLAAAADGDKSTVSDDEKTVDNEKEKPLKNPANTAMTIEVEGQTFKAVSGKDNYYEGNEDVDVTVGEASETISNLGGKANAKAGEKPYSKKPAALNWSLRPASSKGDLDSVEMEGGEKLIGENDPKLTLKEDDLPDVKSESDLKWMGKNEGPVVASPFTHPGIYVLGNHSARRLEGGGTVNSTGGTTIDIKDVTPPTINMTIVDSGGDASFQGMREYGQAADGSKKMEFGRVGAIFSAADSGESGVMKSRE